MVSGLEERPIQEDVLEVSRKEAVAHLNRRKLHPHHGAGTDWSGKHQDVPRTAHVLEVIVKVPLSLKGDAGYKILKVEPGTLVQIQKDIYEVRIDDLLLVKLDGSPQSAGDQIQVRPDYLDSCVGEDLTGHLICAPPEPAPDTCLSDLMLGRVNQQCREHVVLIDHTRAYGSVTNARRREATLYIPAGGLFTLELTCKGGRGKTGQVWHWSTRETSGLFSLQSPTDYCSYKITGPGQLLKGYFLPVESGSVLIDNRFDQDPKELLSLLGLYDEELNILNSDAYSSGYINKTLSYLNRANVTLAEIDQIRNQELWDLLDFGKTEHKLGIASVLTGILILLGLFGCCFCIRQQCQKRRHRQLRDEIRYKSDLDALEEKRRLRDPLSYYH